MLNDTKRPSIQFQLIDGPDANERDQNTAMARENRIESNHVCVYTMVVSKVV